jgi:hypothetical protein
MHASTEDLIVLWCHRVAVALGVILAALVTLAVVTR